MRAHIAAAFLLAAALFGCNSQPDAAAAPAAAEAEAAAPAPSALPTVPLQIVGAGRTSNFTVEVAQTPEEQAQGLMFRERLGPNEGMLFPFNPPRRASFWMKNTLIPLDMIFIRTDGKVESIAANTVPHSLKPVESRGPVAAVLEIAGGRAAELELKEGDSAVRTGGPQP